MRIVAFRKDELLKNELIVAENEELTLERGREILEKLPFYYIVYVIPNKYADQVIEYIRKYQDIPDEIFSKDDFIIWSFHTGEETENIKSALEVGVVLKEESQNKT